MSSSLLLFCTYDIWEVHFISLKREGSCFAKKSLHSLQVFIHALQHNITTAEFDTSLQFAGDPCICLRHGDSWTADYPGVDADAIL